MKEEEGRANRKVTKEKEEAAAAKRQLRSDRSIDGSERERHNAR